MKYTPKIILSLLLIPLVLQAQNDTSSNKANILLDKLRKDLMSMSAQFEQYEIDVNETMSEKSSGNMWLQSPNKFKWEYQLPFPQLIIASGQTVWIYDEDLEQVTVKKQNNTQNPIYVLLNKEQTEKNYHLKFIEKKLEDNDKYQWISMTPKISSDEVKVVWLGISGNDIAVLKLQNQMDNIVIFEFNQMVRNPDLAKGFFTFVPPEGTDVIRDTANMGEF